MTRKRSPEALALLYLRHAFHWTTKKLAAALGFKDEKGLTRYETGERPLSREYLETLVAPLGAPPEAIDVLLWVHDQIVPKPAEATEVASPFDLTARERWRIFRVALTAAWALAERLVPELTRQKRAQKVARVRRAAQELTARLKSASPEERRGLIDLFPEFRSWAVAEALCHASVRAAAHSVEEATELVELAVYVAERLPGETERARTAGYCIGFLGNVARIATDFDAASASFARSWALWRAGRAADWLPLAESRLLDLEASLKIDQRLFQEAESCLDRALAVCEAGTLAAGRVLMQKAHVLEQLGDPAGSLKALEKATPAIEASGDPQLLFGLRFNTVVNLVHLQRYEKGKMLLAEVREMAIEQGRKFHLSRLLWLESRLAAGQGRIEAAIAGLEQVRREFADLPYEAALASLDLAVLYLKEGRTAEVRALAVDMSEIFEVKGIAREALAALALFCEAARKETATVELVLEVIKDVERAQRSAPPPPSGRRGRGKAPS